MSDNDDLPPVIPAEDVAPEKKEVQEKSAKAEKVEKTEKEEKSEKAEKGKAEPVKKSGNELSGKKVTIIVDEPNNSPSTQQFFGINGKGFLITFGEPVTVPAELLNVLNECIETRTIPLAEGGFIERDHVRFSYRVVNK